MELETKLKNINFEYASFIPENGITTAKWNDIFTTNFISIEE